MTTDEYERDFTVFENSNFPGMILPEQFNNTGNAGDGFPGLQLAVRNWVQYYLSGGTMVTGMDMNSYKITNMADPAGDQDAATKKYLDDNNYSDVEASTAINDIFGADGIADATIDLDGNLLDNVNKVILDQISEPSTEADHGVLFIDSSDYELYYKDKDGNLVLLS